ncbi:Oidioi.mRNA.OKI2018_I69.PAR.g11348.t1.cds [Oikopleura dioica]|uniref:Hexosyltransferase n=1 Tax=Oikopleura dioica TaxID=34765 RepID=A0ABN7S123_OIKDI|nr:Oidioi.mRNA.OKI2018_I69.PAR.g11348.t1.cds [Oikopleura dioica]
MFYSWTKQNVPNVKFIYRGDDDNFLNPLGVMKFLEKHWDEANAEAALWGGVIQGMPSVISDTTKLDEIMEERRTDVWPEEVYPKYASGSGHIMNRNALFVLEGQMQLNPLISIDDAFIGISGLEDRIFDVNEFHPWGIKFENGNDFCTIVNAISIHYPKFDYECMLSKILKYAEKCEKMNFTRPEIFLSVVPGIYRKIIINEEQAEYVSKELSNEKPIYKLVYGEFNSEEMGWHIQMLQNDSYIPINAYDKITTANKCPRKLAGLYGLDVFVDCFHEKYN